MKYVSTAAACLAALSAVALAGCGGQQSPPAGTATGGQASSAATVKTIQDRIAADKALSGSQVTVSEQQGSIVLSGTVTSTAQKDEAEKIVLEVQKQQNQQAGLLDNLLVK